MRGAVRAAIRAGSRASSSSRAHRRAARRLPARGAAALPRQRRAVHPRRDDHRLPLAQCGGAQNIYDIDPDLSCWGKALANGFSVSALAGKREFMRLGGLDHYDKPRVFLLSTTHGAETHALAAAMATMRVYRERTGDRAPLQTGDQAVAGIAEAVARRGLANHVQDLRPTLLPAVRHARPRRASRPRPTARCSCRRPSSAAS